MIKNFYFVTSLLALCAVGGLDAAAPTRVGASPRLPLNTTPAVTITNVKSVKTTENFPSHSVSYTQVGFNSEGSTDDVTHYKVTAKGKTVGYVSAVPGQNSHSLTVVHHPNTSITPPTVTPVNDPEEHTRLQASTLPRGTSSSTTGDSGTGTDGSTGGTGGSTGGTGGSTGGTGGSTGGTGGSGTGTGGSGSTDDLTNQIQDALGHPTTELPFDISDVAR